MPEENTENTENTQVPQQQVFIQKIYLKDVSFETPNSPQIFTQNIQPQMKVDLNTQVDILDPNGIYDVSLMVTVTAQYEDKTAFLIEVKQAGIFNITGFDKPQLDGLLATYCPNILFPYIRETISELVSKGGFPQLILQPVNFEAMYAQQLQAQQQQKEGDAEQSGQGSDAVH